MRLATLILSLILMLVVLIQSCATGVVSAVGDKRDAAEAASAGVGIALLYLVGGAFVLPFPLVSVVAFALAGLLGTTFPTAEFTDLRIWGWVGVLLAVMSLAGWAGKRRSGRGSMPPLQARLVADQAAPVGAPPAPQQASNRWAWDCPKCAFRNQPGASFCGNCGTLATPVA